MMCLMSMSELLMISRDVMPYMCGVTLHIPYIVYVGKRKKNTTDPVRPE